jgi:hypothetical protein
MENRERDQMSRNKESTSVGDVNRKTSAQIGKEKSDSSADFGQNTGRAETLKEPNSRGSNSGSDGWDSSSKSSSSGSSKESEPLKNDNGSASGSRH